MRLQLLALAILMGCGENGTLPPADSGVASDTGVDTGIVIPTPDAGTVVEEDAGQQTEPVTIEAGEVSGDWCGVYDVNGNISVAAGQTLSICAGSQIRFANSAGLAVAGTLNVSGETGTVRFEPKVSAWNGISVGGTLQARGIDISGGVNCIIGQAGSTIDVESAVLSCNNSLRLANGGIFRRVMVIGGSSVSITGGNFDIADSTIDLRHPQAAPDCTDWAGGSATIDHVRFTGCHCPLHFGDTDGPIDVSNSIFDDAAIPTMIANATATFTHNHFLGTGPAFLDIGGPFTANIAGNYWGGGAPTLSSTDLGQFVGGDDYATEPFTDVGPR